MSKRATSTSLSRGASGSLPVSHPEIHNRSENMGDKYRGACCANVDRTRLGSNGGAVLSWESWFEVAGSLSDCPRRSVVFNGSGRVQHSSVVRHDQSERGRCHLLARLRTACCARISSVFSRKRCRSKGSLLRCASKRTRVEAAGMHEAFLNYRVFGGKISSGGWPAEAVGMN